MERNKTSTTALLVAWMRAQHYATDGPKIFEDAVAHQLLTASEYEQLEAAYINIIKEFYPDIAASSSDKQVLVKNAMQELASVSQVLSRACYTEEKIVEAFHQGTRQYVLIGAGLDSFVFRYSDFQRELNVFEVDHPATQSFKRQRLQEVGLTPPPNLNYVAADLTEISLAEALMTSPYRQESPAFFSWLGTVMYIPRDKVYQSLHTLRNITVAGSELVFDYFDTDALDPNKAASRVQNMIEAVRRLGEPILSSFDPHEIEIELSQIGFQVREHLSPLEIGRKYFQERTEGQRACEHAHFVHAIVE
jgi:methyltransferase (TIGR00027 family)